MKSRSYNPVGNEEIDKDDKRATGSTQHPKLGDGERIRARCQDRVTGLKSDPCYADEDTEGLYLWPPRSGTI